MSGKFVFGGYQLDCLNDELTHDGNIVPLTPKALALLRYLVESGGRLVRNDELMDVVWSGRVVGDAALKVCISEVRKALHDHPRSPRYIQTVFKRCSNGVQTWLSVYRGD